MKLFLILVKTCENDLLLKDGWRPGMVVCDEETAYGRTFRLQYGGDEMTCYTSRDVADHLIATVGDSFYKTTFELAEFTRR